MAKFQTVKFRDIEPRIDWSKAEPIIFDGELQAIKCGEFRFHPTVNGMATSEEVND